MVEIVDIVSNERWLKDLLAKLSISIYVEDSKTYLTSENFDLLICTEVLKQSEELCTIISEVSSEYLNGKVSFKINALYEQRADGSRPRYGFCTSSIVVGSPFLSAVVALVSKDEISEAEIARAKEKELERNYQEKLIAVSSRILIIFQDACARKIHLFLRQELNAYSMYNIIQLIEEDLEISVGLLGKGRGRSLLTKILCVSKTRVTRFYESVNHPYVYGNDARHIAKKDKPPENEPMYLDEARSFTLQVTNSWFEKKCSEIIN